MKAVITGATGFIGGALARRLVAEGIEVVALVRADSDRGDLADLDITWIVGDITKPETLTHVFDGADWVLHTAGLLGRAGISDKTYLKVNASGARHVFAAVAAARDAGRIREDVRVLHMGSAGVLGPLPKGDRMMAVDESAPLAPSNGYERSKAQAENYAREFILSGLPLMIVRPEFVYGPGDTHVLGIFRAVQRGVFFYIGNGQNTCHPTYIEDLIDGVLLCLREGQPGETYQITGPRPVTFQELAEAIATELGVRKPVVRVPRLLAWVGATGLEAVGKLTGRDVPLSRTGVAFFSEHRRSSYTKAKNVLGYHPQVDLQDGIALSVAWYRSSGLL